MAGLFVVRDILIKKQFAVSMLNPVTIQVQKMFNININKVNQALESLPNEVQRAILSVEQTSNRTVLIKFNHVCLVCNDVTGDCDHFDSV